MTGMPTDGSELDDAWKKELDAWLKSWRDARHLDPWFLGIILGDVRPGEGVLVMAFPDQDARDRLERRREPRYEKGYELPVSLVNEELVPSTSVKLQSTLKLIRETQGLPLVQGLAFLTHLYLFISEWSRHRARDRSLLNGITWGELPEHTDVDAILLARQKSPSASVNALLSGWEQTQGEAARGIVAPADGKLGRPNYLHLPPNWLDRDDIRELYGDEVAAQGIPVIVPADIAPQIPTVLEFLGLKKQVETAHATSVPSETAGSPQTPEPGVDGSDNFEHWDDYRQVKLRGKPFSLTPAQAAAVKVLHESYLKRQPAVSAASLFAEMGKLAPIRVSDMFRKADPRAELIQRVGKDSYRLNL